MMGPTLTIPKTAQSASLPVAPPGAVATGEQQEPRPVFWIEEYDARTAQDSGYLPGARLVLEAADAKRLRTEGLLFDRLGANGVQMLFLLLSFLTPNGLVRPTVVEIAAALGTSERAARDRVRPLLTTIWQGEPILTEIGRDYSAGEGVQGGMDYYVISRRLVGRRKAGDMTVPDTPKIRVAGRDAVLSWNRSRYTHPRAEVEKVVLDQLGLKPIPERSADSGDLGDLRGRLIQAGVSEEWADKLLSGYPVAEIERQLSWLPFRNAREPGRFLVAAVRGRYVLPNLK